MSGFERSQLHVEGEDDKFSLIHLLVRHEVDFEPKTRAVDVNVAGDDVRLLKSIEPSIRAATDRSIGFVVDANSSLAKRWDSIRKKLAAVSVDTPEAIPDNGFVGESPKFRTKVGVWIMPDNEHDGQIEDFLATLIHDKDPLIRHVEEATDKAKELGARFRGSDRSKAIIRSWLAWQDEPGHPYGRRNSEKVLRSSR